MAKKKEKEVVEKTTNEAVETKMATEDGKLKVKKKPSMKKLVQEDEPIKIDLSKPSKTKENEQPVATTETEDVQEKIIEETTDKEESIEQSTEETTEQPILEEVTEEETEEKVEEIIGQVQEAVTESQETGKPIPENIQKLMDFMEETGGDINDYVKLNQDYSKLEDQDLLYEHYKQTKPHLNAEEINFLMEDTFSYDEEVDDERDIRRKKLALKEQVAEAKSQLEENKSKYYEDIKAGSKLTPEQQKAMDFFNRYNKESEENQKVVNAQTNNFLSKTDQVFNNKFKGFEYNVGDKKFRFNVKETGKVKETQSDINNFVKKFLNKDSMMEDAKGYHKSLFTAMNADTIASHFYEQGKADAMKNSIAKAKNVSMDPRQSHGEIEAGGMKFKVLGDDSSDFKFKIKQK
jgi:hypothetical protein